MKLSFGRSVNVSASERAARELTAPGAVIRRQRRVSNKQHSRSPRADGRAAAQHRAGPSPQRFCLEAEGAVRRRRSARATRRGCREKPRQRRSAVGFHNGGRCARVASLQTRDALRSGTWFREALTAARTPRLEVPTPPAIYATASGECDSATSDERSMEEGGYSLQGVRRPLHRIWALCDGRGSRRKRGRHGAMA
jgi:hypothetical protein